MSVTIPIINLNPVIITSAFTPIPSDELADPFEISTTYSVSKGALSSSVNILIPAEVDKNTVVLQQFYDPHTPNQLQFYFVYDLDGTSGGDFQELTIKFNASSAGGIVPLKNITEIFTLLVDLDPKSSRGTYTVVRQTQDV